MIEQVNKQANLAIYDEYHSSKAVETRFEKYFGTDFETIWNSSPFNLKIADSTALNPPTQADNPKSE